MYTSENISFVLIFCFNSREIIHCNFSDFDQNFENMSETFFTEVFSPKLSPPKLFVTNVIKYLVQYSQVIQNQKKSKRHCLFVTVFVIFLSLVFTFRSGSIHFFLPAIHEMKRCDVTHEVSLTTF